ncbi:SatD family protein [Microbacterium enclense]|uniref:SatD family protein n=1 Tax=Microbacterium enclense TaxID=993073 RepID=UPI003423DEB6
MTFAVIADIVASRRLDDRAAAQRQIARVIEHVETDLPAARQPLTPTVGDELQGQYDRLDDALASLLLMRLALPDDIDCRFGVGVGDVRPIVLDDRTVPEGPAWWAARQAVETVERMQQRAAPFARTWITAAEGEDAAMVDTVTVANAYALARDQLVSAMSERTRRLTAGRCLGRSQRDLAESEGISQSAVSQALASAGSAAIVEGFAVLTRGARA